MEVANYPSPRMRLADIAVSAQSYNVPSPNEMEVDAHEYVDVSSIADREPVAIINADGADQDAETLQDLPLANDCMHPVATALP